MMNPEPDDSSEQWRRVGQVLSGYFAAIEAGDPPDRQAVLERHPDLAAGMVPGTPYLTELNRSAVGLRGPLTSEVGCHSAVTTLCSLRAEGLTIGLRNFTRFRTSRVESRGLSRPVLLVGYHPRYGVNPRAGHQ
jgi:hypothetical protein